MVRHRRGFISLQRQAIQANPSTSRDRFLLSGLPLTVPRRQRTRHYDQLVALPLHQPDKNPCFPQHHEGAALATSLLLHLSYLRPPRLRPSHCTQAVCDRPDVQPSIGTGCAEEQGRPYSWTVVNGRASKTRVPALGEATRVKKLEGSERFFPVELVLLSMGFLGPEELVLGDIEKDARSNIKTPPSKYSTSLPGDFTAGYCRRGQSLAVWAFSTSEIPSLFYSIAGNSDSPTPEPQHRDVMEDRPERGTRKPQRYIEEVSKDRGWHMFGADGLKPKRPPITIKRACKKRTGAGGGAQRREAG
ncbi:uncharacterized protein BDZ99DRAFT_514132 [Mytilinidion resinicola]|uniref:FAD/NAD(P)-binding domain-containing protein n=1 Tax=Mytilinidion resinicola TaxID=574789 RepID=A0A6A6Z9W3_9PEZI|nr:uncharacterized protein BDZ99DRAFT_514132 [Mytilinidion resinicola]KAF2817911.1 hypothetical protein BDZ99DRAFT_514132 [Mytilinidion resinicola]